VLVSNSVRPRVSGNQRGPSQQNAFDVDIQRWIPAGVYPRECGDGNERVRAELPQRALARMERGEIREASVQCQPFRFAQYGLLARLIYRSHAAEQS
jgi:hypothetical protein